MKKVKMLVAGKPALVDADMAKKIVRKELLAHTAQDLENLLKLESDPVCQEFLKDSLNEVMGKIIRLNRTIRPCVQFL